jgi:hypothetical protein
MKDSLHVDEALGRAYRALGDDSRPRAARAAAAEAICRRSRSASNGSDRQANFMRPSPGIDRYREGDALVSLTPEGAAASQRYLINIRGNRAGAIRVL